MPYKKILDLREKDALRKYYQNAFPEVFNEYI